MQKNIIFAEKRKKTSKGSTRNIRSAGMIPGIIYGIKQPSILLSINENKIKKMISSSSFYSEILTLEIENKHYKVLPRDVQFDVFSEKILHIDFIRFLDDQMINVSVPVKFVNKTKSPGLKIGGILNIVCHEINIMCFPNEIPSYAIFDLSNIQLGDSIHIRNVELPQNIKNTIPKNYTTIATITAPSSLKSSDAELSNEAETQ